MEEHLLYPFGSTVYVIAFIPLLLVLVGLFFCAADVCLLGDTDYLKVIIYVFLSTISIACTMNKIIGKIYPILGVLLFLGIVCWHGCCCRVVQIGWKILN
jgi:hypothetical protein